MRLVKGQPKQHRCERARLPADVGVWLAEGLAEAVLESEWAQCVVRVIGSPRSAAGLANLGAHGQSSACIGMVYQIECAAGLANRCGPPRRSIA